MRFYSIVTISLYLGCVHAIKKWPQYDQQCRDDAGPPFPDDKKGKKYYDNQKVIPVLDSNGQCAKPLKKACKQHGVPLNAYLEGPIGCKKQGWYCRITPQKGWPPQALTGDLNAGWCNSTASFSDAGYDRDGHCHGSSDDSTYYWWIRDHFNREYNGRVRCCCGWYKEVDGKKSPYPNSMYSRKIANRCDYRRLVTKNEDVTKCRDANEEHGLGFDDIGCDPRLKKKQINKPLKENDNVCWEMQYFGFSEGGGGGSDDGGGSEDEGECEDEGGKFYLKKKANGSLVQKTCAWLRKKTKGQIAKYCKKKNAPDDMDVAKTLCWKTCDTC